MRNNNAECRNGENKLRWVVLGLMILPLAIVVMYAFGVMFINPLPIVIACLMLPALAALFMMLSLCPNKAVWKQVTYAMLSLVVGALLFVAIMFFALHPGATEGGEVHVSPCGQHRILVQMAPGFRARTQRAFPIHHRIFIFAHEIQHDIAMRPEITWEGNRVRLTGAFNPYHYIEF